MTGILTLFVGAILSSILCGTFAQSQCLADSEVEHGCLPGDATIVCSGRGMCICGACECDKRANSEELISGKYCECDNFSCERDQGLLCGGVERGTCECGRCRCQTGWDGDDCTCSTSNATCIPPDGDKICSDHGKCVCGKCKCDETVENRHSGRYCDKCPTCLRR